jgi:hypothetical protein
MDTNGSRYSRGKCTGIIAERRRIDMANYDEKIIHKPLSELPEDISFAEGDWTKNWSYGKWGYAEYAITHVLADGTEHRYSLPRPIGLMLERQFAHGKQEAQRDIRTALGIYD